MCTSRVTGHTSTAVAERLALTSRRCGEKSEHVLGSPNPGEPSDQMEREGGARPGLRGRVSEVPSFQAEAAAVAMAPRSHGATARRGGRGVRKGFPNRGDLGTPGEREGRQLLMSLCHTLTETALYRGAYRYLGWRP